MRQEFQVHILNDNGIEQAKELGETFSDFLDKLEKLIPQAANVNGREMALVRTKLQEASFFAKRAIAVLPGNQKGA